MMCFKSGRKTFSRTKNAYQPVALSFGLEMAGATRNVIAKNAVGMEGTVMTRV